MTYLNEARFKKVFVENAEAVTKTLDDIIKSYISSIEYEKSHGRISPLIAERLKRFHQFDYQFVVERPGKRIRPSIVIIVGEGNGYEGKEDLVHLGCAPEILHNATLVHDDIQDKDIERSNMPTVRKRWMDYLRGEGGVEEEYVVEKADSMSINNGDALLVLPFNIISTSKFDPAVKNKCSYILSKAAREITEGQVLDLSFPERREKVTLKDVLYMYQKKTGSLFEACALMGLVVSEGTEEQESYMSDWSRRYLNWRFQIKDDFLENNIDGKKGRPIGGDLKEGKLTPLVIETFQRGSAEHKKDLRAVLGNRDATIEEINRAIDAMKDSGTVDYLRGLIDDYGEKGKETIENCNFLKGSEELLMDLTEFVGVRDV